MSEHEPELLATWTLSVRAWNALTNNAGIYTVDDLKRVGQIDLLRIDNIGKVTVAEIVALAKEHGIDIPKFSRSRSRSAPATDVEIALMGRIDRLEARVAELDAAIWGKVAALKRG